MFIIDKNKKKTPPSTTPWLESMDGKHVPTSGFTSIPRSVVHVWPKEWYVLGPEHVLVDPVPKLISDHTFEPPDETFEAWRWAEIQDEQCCTLMTWVTRTYVSAFLQGLLIGHLIHAVQAVGLELSEDGPGYAFFGEPPEWWRTSLFELHAPGNQEQLAAAWNLVGEELGYDLFPDE